jgi:hypothetical protein
MDDEAPASPHVYPLRGMRDERTSVGIPVGEGDEVRIDHEIAFAVSASGHGFRSALPQN